MRKIGAGAKIRQVKCWYDAKIGVITGLQFNYVDSLSKTDSDKLVNGPAWMIQHPKAQPKEGVLDMDADDYICGLTVFFEPKRCLQAIRVNTSKGKKKNFGRTENVTPDVDVKTRTLVPPTGAEVICFYGAKKHGLGIVNLGMYIMRNASLETGDKDQD